MFTSARLSSETLALAFRCRVSVSVEPTRKMTTDVVLPLSVLASTTVPEAQCHSPQATLHDAATQAQASTLTFHTENLLLSAGHWPLRATKTAAVHDLDDRPPLSPWISGTRVVTMAITSLEASLGIFPQTCPSL